MNTVITPKIFISYSWTTPEHEQWVLDLAENLVRSGIDIVLDKWELREGNNAHTFMESMVNDSSVTHIIMVIDQKYTERANERSGGVGTESTILSNELYTKKDKNNIVAVLAETNVSIPTFYVGRIYIDLSQDDKFAEEFEKLVRWAFGKFKYEKPTLGTPPSFILADGTGTILDTNLEYRFATDALQKGKPNANGLVKAYLEKFNKELVKYNFVNGKDEAEQFNSYLQSFKSYLAEFKKVLNDVCHYGNPKIHQFYRTFFEELLRYQVIIPNRPGKAIAELEFYANLNFK